jgi:hypothetical protein
MIIFTQGINMRITKNIINEPLMKKLLNASKLNRIVYTLCLYLLIFFLSLNNASAQDTLNSKSWKEKLISWKILKSPLSFFKLADSDQPTAEMSIPVGFTDIEELIRDLQIAGKIARNNALTIRPFYTNSDITYNKLLNIIDPDIENNNQLVNKPNLNISLLPINFTQKLTTHHPYGWNDGAFSLSKGYQFLIGGGVFFQWHKLKIQLRPEFVKTASGNYETNYYWGAVTPSFKKIMPGQSSIRYDLGPLTVGASTENMWWGPGIYNSMLMSNNAPGFLHYNIRNSRPIKTFFGDFSFQLIIGKLLNDSTQGYENYKLNLKTLPEKIRNFNNLIIDFSPKFVKGFHIGVIRSFQNYSTLKTNNGFIFDYLPVLMPFFKNSYNDDGIARDQIANIYSKLLLPKENAEIYFEFGFNDAKQNFRDLMLDMTHSSGYVWGFKKIKYVTKNQYINFNIEIARVAQTPSFLHRDAGNWYEHGGVNQGYTNLNQIMGGVSGFGNNMQALALSYNAGWNKFGIIYQHILQNPYDRVAGINDVGIRSIKWTDYSFGLQTRYHYKKILLSANMEMIKGKNYLWKQDNNTTNLFFYINTIYLW